MISAGVMHRTEVRFYPTRNTPEKLSHVCCFVGSMSHLPSKNSQCDSQFLNDPLLFQQVMSERDALRKQNDHLWAIIAKQRKFMKQLQDQVSSLQLFILQHAKNLNGFEQLFNKRDTSTSIEQVLLRQLPLASGENTAYNDPSLPQKRRTKSLDLLDNAPPSDTLALDMSEGSFMNKPSTSCGAPLEAAQRKLLVRKHLQQFRESRQLNSNPIDSVHMIATSQAPPTLPPPLPPSRPTSGLELKPPLPPPSVTISHLPSLRSLKTQADSTDPSSPQIASAVTQELSSWSSSTRRSSSSDDSRRLSMIAVPSSLLEKLELVEEKLAQTVKEEECTLDITFKSSISGSDSEAEIVSFSDWEQDQSISIPPTSYGNPIKTEEPESIESSNANLHDSLNFDNRSLTNLEGISVAITKSCLEPDANGREQISFIISVRHRKVFQAPEIEIWQIQKSFLNVVALEAALRHVFGKTLLARAGKIPEKADFFKPLPNKTSWRKQELETYLKALCDAIPNDSQDLIKFLSSSFLDSPSQPKYNQPKEGFLYKRGKNLNFWKIRYYKINSNLMEYSEAKNGDILGVINLKNCKIAKQKISSKSQTDYSHGFLILESRNDKFIRHFFCSESDEDRDEWVVALCDQIDKGKDSLFELESEESNSSKLNSVRLSTRNFLTRKASDRRISRDASIRSVDLSAFNGSINQEDIAATDEITSRKALNGLSINDTYVNVTINSAGTSTETMALEESNSFILPGHLSTQSLGSSLAAQVSQAQSSSSFETTSRDGRVDTDKRGSKRRSGFFSKWFKGAAEETGRKQFGVPLELAIMNAKKDTECPCVVYRCVEYLNAMGAEKEEGLYRLSGSSTKITLLKEKFDQYGDIDLFQYKDHAEVHAVTSVLKAFFREIPDGILTKILHQKFIGLTALPEQEARANGLKTLLFQLPSANRATLRVFFSHLCIVVSNSAVNKMTSYNLGIILSPSLGMPVSIFSLLLSDYDNLFAENDISGDIPTSVD